MKVRFWGTRGSLPTPLSAAAVAGKVAAAAARLAEGFTLDSLPFHLRGTYGGNTSCLQVDGRQGRLLLDAGTGLRDYGHWLARQGADAPRDHHILLSHTHWDHIMGLPFFEPLYSAGHRVTVYGCHPSLQQRLAIQWQPSHFPVRFERLADTLRFVQLRHGESVEIAGFTVVPHTQRHPGASYAYRLEQDGRSVVYSTDSEQKGMEDHRTQSFIGFCRTADLLVFDAMYSFVDACTDKEDWGHSSNVSGIEIAKRADVKRLCLFHHDPMHDDQRLDEILVESRRYASHYRPEVPLAVDMAYDGLDVEV
jgi:phosphoribosyl 1,2-cyclic phosphodiesterase